MANELIFPALKRLPTGRMDVMQFDIPPYGRHAFWLLAEKAAKIGNWFCIKVSLPVRPRTTGEKSQCNHLNGHCQQIAVVTGNSFRAVKEFIKREAIGRGYPFETLPPWKGMREGDNIEPKSEADATVEDSKILIDTVHQFADEWEIMLVEENEYGEEPKAT